MFLLPKDLEIVQLGTFELEKENETKINLNIFNVKELEIEIVETFISQTKKKCNINEIMIFGYIQSYNNLVRIRIEDVRVTNTFNFSCNILYFE